MIRHVDEIKAIPRQANIKCFYKRAGSEFGCHQHIAEDANALPGNHRLDCVQFRA